MSYIVCVCGGSGSGKSTFTGKLLQELGDSAASSRTTTTTSTPRG